MLQFDQFDVSKTGTLSQEDLQKYTDAIEKVQEANKAAVSPTRDKRQHWLARTGTGLKRAVTQRLKTGPLNELEA
jgi:hypothetical protein